MQIEVKQDYLSLGACLSGREYPWRVMQYILGPVGTSLELNTEPLQLSRVQLDPKPYFPQKDLLEFMGRKMPFQWYGFTVQETNHHHYTQRRLRSEKKPTPGSHFYVSLLPDPLDFTTFTSMAFLLLVPFPSHLDEDPQGDRKMKSAQPECWLLQPHR